MDDWTVEPIGSKPVPENEDGTPRYSLLEVLARDERSGIAKTAPGRYRSTTPAPYPRG